MVLLGVIRWFLKGLLILGGIYLKNIIGRSIEGIKYYQKKEVLVKSTSFLSI
jgi:hypothetical protein